jgi:hypothetical protein
MSGGRSAVGRHGTGVQDVAHLSHFLEFSRHNGSRDGRRRTWRECMLTGRYQLYSEPAATTFASRTSACQGKDMGSAQRNLAAEDQFPRGTIGAEMTSARAPRRS